MHFSAKTRPATAVSRVRCRGCAGAVRQGRGLHGRGDEPECRAWESVIQRVTLAEFRNVVLLLRAFKKTHADQDDMRHHVTGLAAGAVSTESALGAILKC